MKKTSILNDEEIKAVLSGLRALMPNLATIAGQKEHDLEAGVRLMSLVSKCTEAREKLGLSIKEAAQQLKAPQRNIKNIEAGMVREGECEVLRRYIALLGIERWVKKWITANEDLAERLGLVVTASTARKTPGKKTVRIRKALAKKSKGSASIRQEKPSTRVMSDLDIDYEMYLESYAEDDDDGKRPKLSKTKFAELSGEMMDLINWENFEPLPAAEKRRMKELGYLLIG